ncbi:hypothetical protein CcarbDRAFT_3318 [Clostridium carboxidivorans P7]|uniref:Uncharacterized protein n=1 Tax=Clostridium carboxidivorans P7 TaxID=536227 RepID=C6PX01_9CLOT|nr:hypothetical protein CcarbDRAFT_3318 [Clostridium carboxidivorans P7]
MFIKISVKNLNMISPKNKKVLKDVSIEMEGPGIN